MPPWQNTIARGVKFLAPHHGGHVSAFFAEGTNSDARRGLSANKDALLNEVLYPLQKRHFDRNLLKNSA
jgi:hypothetical protein